MPIALVVLALALGAVAAALVLTRRGSSTTTISTVAAQSPAVSTSSSTGVTSPAAAAPTSTTPTAPAPAPPPKPPAPVLSPPAAALARYWHLVNTGHYIQAYANETPHEQSMESAFLSDKNTARPMIHVVFLGRPSSQSGDADVRIRFYARDRRPSPGSDTSCRLFDMVAHMVQGSSGAWSYDGPVPGTDNATVLPGDPNCHP